MHPKSRKTSQKVSSCLLPTTVAIPEAARPPAVFQAEGARVATSSWQKSSKKSVTTSLKRFARIILRPLAIRVKASTELTDPNGRATASKKYTWESAGRPRISWVSRQLPTRLQCLPPSQEGATQPSKNHPGRARKISRLLEELQQRISPLRKCCRFLPGQSFHGKFIEELIKYCEKSSTGRILLPCLTPKRLEGIQLGPCRSVICAAVIVGCLQHSLFPDGFSNFQIGPDLLAFSNNSMLRAYRRKGTRA